MIVLLSNKTTIYDKEEKSRAYPSKIKGKPGYYHVCYDTGNKQTGENCIMVSYKSKNLRDKDFDILG